LAFASAYLDPPAAILPEDVLSENFLISFFSCHDNWLLVVPDKFEWSTDWEKDALFSVLLSPEEMPLGSDLLPIGDAFLSSGRLFPLSPPSLADGATPLASLT